MRDRDVAEPVLDRAGVDAVVGERLRFAIQDARHHLCGHAICASALGDERVEAVSTPITCTAGHWPSPRAALAAAARIHDRQVSLTSASGCATMVANMIPLMMTDQAVSQ